jgi:hypothetical protein
LYFWVGPEVTENAHEKGSPSWTIFELFPLPLRNVGQGTAQEWLHFGVISLDKRFYQDLEISESEA